MSNRTPLFQPNAQLQMILEEVNDLVGEAERSRFGTTGQTPELPVAFVVGAPRSGTTLGVQWLGATGAFAYPTNLISRFYRAPYLGARIQRLLTDPAFDFAGEMTGAGVAGKPWKSTVGKTVGMLEPHEFSFFWRRFYPVKQARPLTPDELGRADAAGFAHGLALLERGLGRPLVMKGILLQYNLDHLAALLPTALFVRTVRDEVDVVRSLLGARRRVSGGIMEWFSVEPPGTAWLRDQDPYVQVAGQVVFTNRAIESQCAGIPESRVLTLRYETVCADPSEVYTEIAGRLRAMGHAVPERYAGPASFPRPTGHKHDPEEDRRIRDAIASAELAWDREVASSSAAGR
jgi:hypothetical protein